MPSTFFSEAAVGIGVWVKRFQNSLDRARARRAHREAVQKAGGEAIYRYEQEEIEEWRHAISVPHAQLRAAFRFSDSIETLPYDMSETPLDSIAEIIKVPEPIRKNIGEGGGGGGDVPSSPAWARAEKSYSIDSRINGSKLLDPNAVLDDCRLSPFVAFSYYRRHLTQNFSTFGTTYVSPRKRAELDYAPGVSTFNRPQFVAVIRDGFGIREIPQTFAGFASVRRETYLKEPERVCILGEVDDDGDTINIRRMVIDGKPRKLTRDNVAFGIAYATNLVTQIFEGKDYNPAQAMREALVSTRGSPPAFAPGSRQDPR